MIAYYDYTDESIPFDENTFDTSLIKMIDKATIKKLIRYSDTRIKIPFKNGYIQYLTIEEYGTDFVTFILKDKKGEDIAECQLVTGAELPKLLNELPINNGTNDKYVLAYTVYDSMKEKYIDVNFNYCVCFSCKLLQTKVFEIIKNLERMEKIESLDD